MSVLEKADNAADSLHCGLCCSTSSPVWMSSDLVMPASERTALWCAAQLYPCRMQSHCCFCMDCFTLLDDWDQHNTAAKRTMERIRDRIDRFANSMLYTHAQNGSTSLRQLHKNTQRGDRQDASHEDELSTNMSEQPVDGEGLVGDAGGSSITEAIGHQKAQFGYCETNREKPLTSKFFQHDENGKSECEDAVNKEVTNSVTELSSLLPGCNYRRDNIGENVKASDAFKVNDTANGQDLTNNFKEAVDDASVDRKVSDINREETTSPNELRSDKFENRTALAGDGGKKPILPVNFLCHMCEKTFVRRDSLHNHLALHSGIKRHWCAECDVAFQYRDGLLVHRRRYHRLSLLQCSICSKQFEKSCNYQRHLRVHSQTKPFTCHKCSKGFIQSNGLKRHLKTVHAERGTLRIKSNSTPKSKSDEKA